jgi:hypothetical protein
MLEFEPKDSPFIDVGVVGGLNHTLSFINPLLLFEIPSHLKSF